MLFRDNKVHSASFVSPDNPVAFDFPSAGLFLVAIKLLLLVLLVFCHLLRQQNGLQKFSNKRGI